MRMMSRMDQRYNFMSFDMAMDLVRSVEFQGSLAFLVTGMLLFYAAKLVRALFAPLNYKMDMTTKYYCKNLGEIDNKSKTRPKGLELTKKNEDHEPNDSTTNRKSLFESGLTQEVVKYVNGWIPVVESSKVGINQIKSATVYGKDLIVTRADDGQVHVLDAYCPHGGAHIGIGGMVKKIDNESCVQCPFHGWSFRAADGQCVDVPYQKKKCIPSQAKINSWTCCDIDGLIYIWHDIDGNPPAWTMKPTPEVASGQWQQMGRSIHKSNLEMEYMQENGADLNHFQAIHEDIIFLGNLDNLPANKYLQRYVKHCWEPDWKPVNDKHGRPTHIAQLTLKSHISIFGFKIVQLNLVANQIGPARVRLLYDSKWLGRGMLSMNSIPVSGRLVKYIQHIYCENTFLGRLQAKMFLLAEIKMLERDQVIWNHKKYLKNPILVPEDRAFKRFKIWYQQFYRRKVKIGEDNDEKQSSIFDKEPVDSNYAQESNLEF